MKVLLLGGNGMLGPSVIDALEGDHELVITDLNPPENSPHETMSVDIADYDQVRRAAEGTDAIINCSVLRHDRKIAFDVNALGTYNSIRAAVDLGHKRFVNTGPHFTVAGSLYYEYDFGLKEEVPAHSDTNLYALSKACGQEICRIFSEHYPIHVLCALFLNFRDPEPAPGDEVRRLNPFSVTFRDAGRALRRCLEVDTATLPSRNEVFFILTDLPHGKFANAKAKQLLGWEPEDKLEGYWRR
ncbi:MAG: NAD-dependent epimerase/dehydratase family protein [Candidatus Latescibacterota bacterium]|nr:NAD-dependent epimerase/dehydratase family protein [Candidatus Latescibacterota bacterium]